MLEIIHQKEIQKIINLFLRKVREIIQKVLIYKDLFKRRVRLARISQEEQVFLGKHEQLQWRIVEFLRDNNFLK